MDAIKFVDWDKKPRTMLRFLKPGDIFCFRRSADAYCFGRLITKVSFGHFGEIFSYASNLPIITERDVLKGKRLLGPLCLDSYTLFDRKILGDWRIIGHQSDFFPENVDGIYFSTGMPGSGRAVDVFGNEVFLDKAEVKKCLAYSPLSDPPIQRMLDEIDFPGDDLVIISPKAATSTTSPAGA